MSWETLGFIMLAGGVLVFALLFSVGRRVAASARGGLVETLLQAIGLALVGFGASLAAMVFV